MIAAALQRVLTGHCDCGLPAAAGELLADCGKNRSNKRFANLSPNHLGPQQKRVHDDFFVVLTSCAFLGSDSKH
jgi:hypothetical protein